MFPKPILWRLVVLRNSSHTQQQFSLTILETAQTEKSLKEFKLKK